MEQKPAKKLLDQVREIIRMKHYSPRTEKTYVGWIRRYILLRVVAAELAMRNAVRHQPLQCVDVMVDLPDVRQ